MYERGYNRRYSGGYSNRGGGGYYGRSGGGDRYGYRDDFNGSGGRGYGRGNWGRGGGYDGGYGARQPKKRSGAELTVIKKGTYAGDQCAVGWNYSRRGGLVRILAAPYHKSKEHKSGNGRVFWTWIAKIQREGQRDEVLPCLYYPDTGQVIIQEMSWCISTKKNYTGPYFRRNRR